MRRPDFAALARADAAFARLVRRGPDGDARLDWGDPTALAELCRVLLLHDFGVRWTLPARALCPTVPSRLNYLLWIEDLLALGPPPPQPIISLDIGTGASCIYPLLGAAHFGWQFLATEVDPISVEAARHNVALNGWEERIEVRQVAIAAASVEQQLHVLCNRPPCPPYCCCSTRRATTTATRATTPRHRRRSPSRSGPRTGTTRDRTSATTASAPTSLLPARTSPRRSSFAMTDRGGWRAILR